MLSFWNNFDDVCERSKEKEKIRAKKEKRRTWKSFRIDKQRRRSLLYSLSVNWTMAISNFQCAQLFKMAQNKTFHTEEWIFMYLVVVKYKLSHLNCHILSVCFKAFLWFYYWTFSFHSEHRMKNTKIDLSINSIGTSHVLLYNNMHCYCYKCVFVSEEKRLLLLCTIAAAAAEKVKKSFYFLKYRINL